MLLEHKVQMTIKKTHAHRVVKVLFFYSRCLFNLSKSESRKMAPNQSDVGTCSNFVERCVQILISVLLNTHFGDRHNRLILILRIGASYLQNRVTAALKPAIRSQFVLS